MSAQTTAPIIPSPANLGAKIGTTYPTITRSTAAAMPGHSRSGRREAVSFMFIQIASAAVTRTLDESRRESTALDVERLRRVPAFAPLGSYGAAGPQALLSKLRRDPLSFLRDWPLLALGDVTRALIEPASDRIILALARAVVRAPKVLADGATGVAS